LSHYFVCQFILFYVEMSHEYLKAELTAIHNLNTHKRYVIQAATPHKYRESIIKYDLKMNSMKYCRRVILNNSHSNYYHNGYNLFMVINFRCSFTQLLLPTTTLPLHSYKFRVCVLLQEMKNICSHSNRVFNVTSNSDNVGIQ
jgi:hypothetical protein